MSDPVTSAGSPIETGSRSDRARLIDQHQVGRVGGPGQITGQVGKSDADEDDFSIAQLPGGDGSHHFSGGIAHLYTGMSI